MQRRSFLRAAAAAGLGLTIPSAIGKTEAAETFGGPYWVLVHAGGGWDPTLLFDPNLSRDHTSAYSEIGQIGNIRYAPTAIDAEALNINENEASQLLSNEQFVQRWGNRLTVMNGVDTLTNNHDSGTRSVWSGQTQEGYPSVGALVAATYGAGLPMAYVSGGGFDATEGIVGLTRVSNVDALTRIARPNVFDPNNEDSDNFHTPDTWQRIRQAQGARTARLKEGANLLRPKAALGSLELARAADGELSRLALPDDLVDLQGLDDLERLMRQSQIALHAFQSGIAASAALSIGGFDTHANNDRDQRRQLAKLLTGVDFLMTYAQQLGLADKLYVVVGSDFGRTPYNDRNGKDHHPVTSAFAMGPNVPGDRVVGSSTEARIAQPFNDEVITPTAINKALRRVAGVDEALTSKFPLPGPELPIFG